MIEAAWSDGLMCRWSRWRAVDDYHLVIEMPRHNVCDMRGCIKAALALCPTVRRIDTVQDGELDTAYLLGDDGQWIAKDARRYIQKAEPRYKLLTRDDLYKMPPWVINNPTLSSGK